MYLGETLSMGISTQAQMNTLEKDLDLKDEKISEAEQMIWEFQKPLQLESTIFLHSLSLVVAMIFEQNT